MAQDEADDGGRALEKMRRGGRPGAPSTSSVLDDHMPGMTASSSRARSARTRRSRQPPW
jgi:hypothetical protein